MATSLEDFKADYDWRSAFHEAVYHSCGSYDVIGPIENVTRVIHSIEGENDEADWLAIVEWSGPEGKFAVMSAGCDYTGWDCRAGGSIDFYESAAVALSSLTPEQARRLGLPHDATP
jgi:hypothetical protein